MYKSVLLPLAKVDISDAAEWYNWKQKGLGKQFTNELRTKVSFLRENPKACAVRYDDVRCAVLNNFPFMIHYILNQENKTIIIIAVFHTSLSSNRWRERRDRKK